MYFVSCCIDLNLIAVEVFNLKLGESESRASKISEDHVIFKILIVLTSRENLLYTTF